SYGSSANSAKNPFQEYTGLSGMQPHRNPSIAPTSQHHHGAVDQSQDRRPSISLSQEATMRCNRTAVVRLSLSLLLLLFVIAADRLEGQAAQQQGSASSTRLELSSASAAAKAEFWAGIDDWQNFAWSSAEKRFNRAV